MFVAVSLALPVCVHVLASDCVGLSVYVCVLRRVSVRIRVSFSVRGVFVTVFLFMTVTVGGRVRIRIPGRVRGRCLWPSP